MLLKPQTDLKTFNAKIANLTRVSTGRNDLWLHFAYPLRDWYLYSKFDDGVPVGGRIDTVNVFAMIAAFILLIACINFMNLSTARSEKRAKEVGIRKVAGAGRGLLIGQFMAESLLTVVISGALSLALVQLVLPVFDRLIGTPLTIPYDVPGFWLSTVVRDFVYGTPYGEVPPAMIQGPASAVFTTMHIRFNPGNPIQLKSRAASPARERSALLAGDCLRLVRSWGRRSLHRGDSELALSTRRGWPAAG